MFRRTIVASFALALALMLSFAAAEDRNKSAAGADQRDRAAQSTDAAAAPTDTATDAAQPAAAREAADAAPKDPTQAFVTEAYSANMFEIQAGQWVAQKAQDDQIRQFARMIVQDHQKANQQLKQVAQSANVPIQEKLDPVHQAKLQKMQQCQASELSRKFAFGQVAGHTMSVLEYQYQSQNAQNDQVRQYASQTLPKLQQHLKQATDLAHQQIRGAEARPAGERLPGEAEQPGQDATDRGSDADTDAGGGASDTPGQSGGATNRDQSE